MLEWLTKYELWVRVDGSWLIVQLRKVRIAARLALLIEGKEETLITLPEDNEVTITAAGRSANNKPAPIDPNFELEWTVAPAGVVALFPVSGTPTCKVGFVAPGTAVITAKGDADLTSGIKEIFGTIDITAVGAQADHLELTAGPVSPIVIP